jgi:hypothetical protein
MASLGNVVTIGIATLGVGFQRRFQWNMEDHEREKWRLLEVSP